MPLRREKKEPPTHLWAVGLGAGILGAAAIALRCAIRPATKQKIPEAISPVQFKTRVFQTSRGEIVFHEAGEGPPVIFVHSVGVGASSYEWSKVYPELAKTNRVLALDLVGFGESQRPARISSPEDHSVALADFIHALCWGERPVLIGSGLGAGFCVLTASQHPELVTRLILLLPLGLTGASGRGSGSLPLELRIATRLPILNRFVYRNYLSGRPTLSAWMQRYGFVDQTHATNEVLDVYATCAQQLGAEYGIFSLLRGRFKFDIERRLLDLPHPVTLIWGDNSPAGVTKAKKLAARIRLCRLEFLSDVRLLAAIEAADRLVQLLSEELKNEIRVLKAS